MSEVVTVTITGANDAPTIDATGTGDTISVVRTETDAGLEADGTLTIADVDVTDIVSVSSALNTTATTGDQDGLTMAQFEAMFTVTGGLDCTQTSGQIN